MYSMDTIYTFKKHLSVEKHITETGMVQKFKKEHFKLMSILFITFMTREGF